jgi:hypothetical protein
VVDQSVPLRVLAAPVSDAYDGYTVFVDNAVLDARRTVLNVRIHGTFPTWEDPSQKPRMCQEPAVLVLPDSAALRQSQSVGSPSGSEYQWQMVFGAIPPGIEQAVLELPCLPELPAGEGPQNWQIPLAFIPAPPETTVFPVIERNESGSTDPVAPVPEEKMQEGLSLQGTATLDDGYFLQTELRWNYDPTYFEVQAYSDAIHLFDQAGNEQSIWQTGQEQATAPAMDEFMILNLQTGPIHSTGKLQVVVDYIGMAMNSATAFSFDAGPDPQPGQTWQLNQDLDVNGYDLKVLQAEYIRPAADQPAMLLLYLEANQDVLMVTAMDTEHVIFGTAGSPNSEHVPFRTGWYYQGDFPTGTIQVEITTITIRKAGPWSLEWSPSGPVDTAAIPEVPITLEQGVCSDQASFSTALPAGLGGRVATMERNGEAFEIYVSDLDGGNRLLIGPGIFPDLSPDGRSVVYTGLDGGLHIHDLTAHRTCSSRTLSSTASITTDPAGLQMAGGSPSSG